MRCVGAQNPDENLTTHMIYLCYCMHIETISRPTLYFAILFLFAGVWESLIFDTAVKDEVLNYAMTMLMYSDKNIDRNIICCNRVVLLHGMLLS